jgi:PAS domain S-box-containing protein
MKLRNLLNIHSLQSRLILVGAAIFGVSMFLGRLWSDWHISQHLAGRPAGAGIEIDPGELTRIVFGMAFIIAFILSAALLITLRLMVINRVARIQNVISAHIEGREDELVPDLGRDEIGDLARRFNDMVNAIKQSEAKRAELTRQLSIHEQALNQIAIVSEADSQGRITYVNDLFCQISGYSRAELIGKDHRVLNSGHHPKTFFREMWATIGAGRVWQDEVCNRAKDGSVYWVYGTIVPFMGSDGKPQRYLSIRVPITDRKLAEEKVIEQRKAVELAKAKSEFLNIISHELRTPLTVIKEGALIIQDGSAGPLNERQKKFADLIMKNIERLMTLINDLLNIQKLEAKAMSFMIGPTRIGEAVAEAAESLAVNAEAAGVRLINQTQENLPVIQSDQSRIVQVLYNLIGNAIKFSSPGTEVRVRTSSGDNFVRVDVIDQAGGMRPEDLPKLFQSFSQVKSMHERKTGGSGLGLAISKEIITQLNGKINVESELGKGSIFYFILPIVDRRRAAE